MLGGNAAKRRCGLVERPSHLGNEDPHLTPVSECILVLPVVRRDVAVAGAVVEGRACGVPALLAAECCAPDVLARAAESVGVALIGGRLAALGI